MAVNWNWNMKMGVITWNNSNTEKVEKVKVNLYKGNCLGVVINDYKDKETNKKMYQFVTFFDDIDHLKRCLGLLKCWDGTTKNIFKNIILKVKLNIYFKDCIKMAELFAKGGIKVELYYKEIK